MVSMIENRDWWPTESRVIKFFGASNLAAIIRDYRPKSFVYNNERYIDPAAINKWRSDQRKNKLNAIRGQYFTVNGQPVAKIPGDLISIQESLKLFPKGAKLATVWRWFVVNGMVTVYHNMAYKTRSNMVSQAEVRSFVAKFHSYFFPPGKLYQLKEFGKIIAPDPSRPVSRQTVASWIDKKKITYVETPTKERLLPESVLEIGHELALKSIIFHSR